MDETNKIAAKAPVERPAPKLGMGCLLPLAVLVIAVVVTIWLIKSKPSKEAPLAEEKTWNVRAETVAPSMHAPQLGLFGVIEAPQSARLTASIAADVLSVPARAGQPVEKGELLVELDGVEARLVLERAEAELALEAAQHAANKKSLVRERELLKLAERAVDRAANLAKRKLSSEAQLDEARRQLEVQRLAVINRELAVAQHEPRRKQLQAKVDRAQLDFDRSRVTAPFAGQVVSINVAAGDRVGPGQLVADVFSADEFEVRAQIPNQKLALVREALAGNSGLAANIRLDGNVFEAELTRLSGASSAGSGGLDAFFKINGTPAGALQRGRTTEVRVSLPPVSDAVALPFEALFGLDRVYRVDESRLTPVQVSRIGEAVGADGQRRMLVSSPELEPGTQVIVTQLPNAAAGLRVNVVDSETP